MRILSDCRELFVITSLLWLEPEMPSAKNDRLRDEAVRQFGLPVHVPTHSEEGAVGAALTAAVGSGRLSRLKPRVNGWVDSLRTHRRPAHILKAG